ncbi:MAG: proteasome subunit beta [Promethearchaeota archaeon]
MLEIGDYLKDGRLMTGTTTISLVVKDAVVVATESQATAGYLVATKNAQKLFKISDHIACTISGGVADCQYIIDQARAIARLREIEQGNEPSLKYIANLIRNILFGGRSYYLSMMLVVGYSTIDGKPKIYGCDLIGSMFEEDEYQTFGSGSTYALGVLEADYKKDMSVEEGIELAKRAITAARNRDIASGSKIQLAVIDKNGYRQVE